MYREKTDLFKIKIKYLIDRTVFYTQSKISYLSPLNFLNILFIFRVSVNWYRDDKKKFVYAKAA